MLPHSQTFCRSIKYVCQGFGIWQVKSFGLPGRVLGSGILLQEACSQPHERQKGKGKINPIHRISADNIKGAWVWGSFFAHQRKKPIALSHQRGTSYLWGEVIIWNTRAESQLTKTQHHLGATIYTQCKTLPRRWNKYFLFLSFRNHSFPRTIVIVQWVRCFPCMWPTWVQYLEPQYGSICFLRSEPGGLLGVLHY